MIKEAAEDPSKLKEADLIYRRRIERYLDLGMGQCELKIPRIAETVATALMFFHEKDYILDEWVIMPNHVHLMIIPLGGHTLSKILAGRKTYTARQANGLLNRTGTRFWQPESYDHWIRSDEEKDRIRRYIRNNPVKAGLCKTPEAWPWSSAGWKKSA